MSCKDDSEIDAKNTFQKLKEKRKDELLSRFDYWIVGGVRDQYFHGWPNNSTYKECFVFKWKDKRQYHRMYGFLCNPKPVSARHFRLCVLISHAIKNTWETDPAELDGANRLRLDKNVIAAIKKKFPEYGGN